eukprot:2704948-Prymnesium_polylepis.1
MAAAAAKAEALAAVPSTVAGALQEAERIAGDAVPLLRELREPVGSQTEHTIQALLEWSFSELIANRVLAQRHAELERDPSTESMMIEPDCPLHAVLEHAIEETRAFARE